MPEDDVTRRTLMASERTYLAWWRTGLTAFAVSLAAGQIVPALTDDETRWPYTLIGAAFALLGIAFTYLAYARERAIERALQEGGYAPPSDRLLSGLTAAGVVLGIALLLVILTFT
jgi:putative membrane protein